jgi:hypothetical protein
VINDDKISLRTPYQANFVDQLKLRIPSYARKWDPTAKTWMVDTTFHKIAVDLCNACFAQVIIDDRRQKQHRTNGRSTGATDWAAAMFAELPERLHKPIYKALAKNLHPDTGGNSEAMKKLTAAYDKRGAA